MRNSITPRLFSLSSALPGCMFEGVGSSPFAHRGVLGAMVPESTGVGDGAVGGREEIQALERTQPVLPMGLGYVEGVTHDYRSEEHTSELQSLMSISYAVFCLNKKKKDKKNT